MKLNDLVQLPGFSLLVEGVDLNREVKGLKCSDLLSWVMANAGDGDVWVTVQTHMNIVAVAALLEMACIIAPEGIEMEVGTLEKAKEQNVAILSADTDAFGIFSRLYEAGLRQ